MTERRKTPEPNVYIPGTARRDGGKTPASRETDDQGKTISVPFPGRKPSHSARSGSTSQR